MSGARIRLGALALGLSALLFTAFPLVRPFFRLDPRSPDETLAAASPVITSTPWVLSHLVAKLVSILAMCWFLYLLEPLSSTGLAFASFLVTFGITLLLAAASLACVLQRRPVSARGVLAWLAYPLAASSLLLLFLFISDGCGVIDECGLVYIPGAVPTGRSKTRVKHLEGPWYHLYSVF